MLILKSEKIGQIGAFIQYHFCRYFSGVNGSPASGLEGRLGAYPAAEAGNHFISHYCRRSLGPAVVAVRFNSYKPELRCQRALFRAHDNSLRIYPVIFL